MDVLSWHVDTQPKTPEQQDSDLLFPAVNGKFRSPLVLNKPLANVAAELGLGKQVTQRALRRTFEGDPPLRPHRDRPKWGGKWGGHLAKWGGKEKSRVRAPPQPAAFASFSSSGRRDLNPRRPPWQTDSDPRPARQI